MAFSTVPVATAALDVLLPIGSVFAAGLALSFLVYRAARSPPLASQGARLYHSPLRHLLLVAIVVGVLAIGAAIAKLFDLPLGVAGIALLGPALFCYAHLGVLAAAHGYRQLDLDTAAVSEASDAALGGTALSDFIMAYAAWTTFVAERHTALPFVCLALFVLAVPAAFVVGPPIGLPEPLWAGAVVAIEAIALTIGTGHRRRMPDAPEERVREAIAESESAT